MDVINFGTELKHSISEWLERMAKGLEPGRFRLCSKRNFAPTSGHIGQFVTCFAMKTAWQIGLWEEWPAARREACVRFVQSFQQKDGNFVDQGMLKRIFWGSAPGLLRRGRFEEWKTGVIPRAIRAETRQSASTLLMVGRQLPYRLPLEFGTTKKVKNFIKALPWNQPWGAGSHTSHLIFFLHANGLSFNSPENWPELMNAAFDELDQLRDAKTGTWYFGEAPNNIKINGAMKVLTAYKWAGRSLCNARELLDFALAQPFEGDGCGFLNRLFVVREASRHLPEYRKGDIEKLAIKALTKINQFHRQDGAFSFNLNCSQRRYYDAWVSLGGKQSDMHGTAMLTWAAALCFELLGAADSIGWRSLTP